MAAVEEEDLVAAMCKARGLALGVFRTGLYAVIVPELQADYSYRVLCGPAGLEDCERWLDS